MNDVHRRDLLKLIGCVVGADLLHAQHAELSGGPFRVPIDYRPRFLTRWEYELTMQLSQSIIPRDADSPGAVEAGVPWFIDTVLLYADAKRQQGWRTGLAALDECSSRLTGNTFLHCSASDRLQVLQHLSQNEEDPTSPEDQF